MGLIAGMTKVLALVLTGTDIRGPGGGPGALTLPSRDPFYHLPPGYESAEPGTIFHFRKPPVALADPLRHAVADAFQVLYRTTDSFDEPAVAVTTILIPPKPDHTKILAYLSIHDSASNDCSPSYTVQRGADKGDLVGGAMDEVQRLAMVGALNNGWIVTMPDYEGLNAAFLANRKAAFATLDALRATLSSHMFTGVSPDARAAVWGYSGGSIVAGLAAEYQEFYAPELHIVGAAMGGMIADIGSSMKTINKQGNACLIAMGLYGLANEYTELERIIEEELVDDPVKKDRFRNARNICLGTGIVHYPFFDMLSYFKDPKFMDKNEHIQKIIKENNAGHHSTRIPLLIYKGVLDPTSLSPETDSLVARYCDMGVTVDYRKLVLGGHVTLGATGIPEAISWLIDRLNGVPGPAKCTRSIHLSALLDPSALRVEERYLVTALNSVLDDSKHILSEVRPDTVRHTLSDAFEEII